jgi:hypothetical protein
MSPVGFIKKPKLFMIIGTCLMISFVVMEFLMIMGVIINTSFTPHLVGYGLSTGGMFLAIIGFVSDYKSKNQK